MDIKNWVRQIRSGKIRFRGHSIVVDLRRFRIYESFNQIKNAVATVIRAIRNVKGDEVRIYICNAVPSRHKVLGLRVERFNDMLNDAIDSLRANRKLSKIFLADMYGQFVKTPGRNWKYF